jgi:hypothetical protein
LISGSILIPTRCSLRFSMSIRQPPDAAGDRYIYA